LIVRPLPAGPAVKGIDGRAALDCAIAAAAAASPGGCVRIETDMRAHLNPTRMGEIAKAGARLARRLAALCPVCSAPGWGLVRIRSGQPCSACGTQTALPRGEIFGCAGCGAEEDVPLPGAADPAHCPNCNP
jgi:hypothetical protein